MASPALKLAIGKMPNNKLELNGAQLHAELVAKKTFSAIISLMGY